VGLFSAKGGLQKLVYCERHSRSQKKVCHLLTNVILLVRCLSEGTDHRSFVGRWQEDAALPLRDCERVDPKELSQLHLG